MPFFKEYDRPYFEVQYVYVTHLKTPADLGKFTSTMIHILKFLVWLLVNVDTEVQNVNYEMWGPILLRF